MEFSRPKYWSGKPFPSPGDLPNPVIEPRSPTLQADSLPAEPQGSPKTLWVADNKEVLLAPITQTDVRISSSTTLADLPPWWLRLELDSLSCSGAE